MTVQTNHILQTTTTDNSSIQLPPKQLKVGLFIDDFMLPAWLLKSIEDILQLEVVTISLIVKNQDLPTPASLGTRVKNRLFQVLLQLDHQLFDGNPNALNPKNLQTILPNTPVLTSNSIQIVNEISFEKRFIEKIQQFELDVIIKLGFDDFCTDLRSLAKYGIWSFSNGFLQTLQEVLQNKEATQLSLISSSVGFEEAQILVQSFSGTEESSLQQNLNKLYWKAASFIPRQLNFLYQNGEICKQTTCSKATVLECRASNKSFSNFTILRLGVLYYLSKIGQKLLRQFYQQQWILLYQFNNNVGFTANFSTFQKIIPPKDRFWADPFVVKKENKYFVFIEELLYNRGLGHISYFEIDEQGNYSSPQKIIEQSYHLSYPFVFEQDDTFFMIPETKGNKCIELYQCTAFPDKWEKIYTILDNIRVVDTTLHVQDGKYWLFTSIKTHEGASSNEELFLFFSDTLLTNNWTAHPLNPIVSDVKNARPAGKIFSHQGHLYRPAQNCAKRYGYGININQITALTETTYQEKLVQSILPDWDKNILGTHTFNRANNLTISDAIWKRRK